MTQILFLKKIKLAPMAEKLARLADVKKKIKTCAFGKIRLKRTNLRERTNRPQSDTEVTEK
jgi:hypothetical protein